MAPLSGAGDDGRGPGQVTIGDELQSILQQQHLGV